MYKAIHHDAAGPLTDTAEYIRRHDVIYNRPALKPWEGMPVGNGSMGGLLYHTEDGIHMQVNHTDVIDFAPDGPMKAWAWEAEEKNTAPAALGAVHIRSDLPCFDWVYLEEYEERLNLADGCVEGIAKTPFAQVKWRVYGIGDPDLLVFEIEARQQEEAAWTVRAERWPSPNFFHHYEQIVPAYEKNLDKISAEVQGDALVLTQDLGRCKAALALRLEGEKAAVKLIHSRGGEFCLEKKKEHRFRLILSGAACEDGTAGELGAAARDKSLGGVKTEPGLDLFLKNRQAWRGFWQKSFVHIEKQDYIENLYYIYLYQLNSCGRGKYPVTFAGLWSWMKDSRNWGHFYHWNHQQTYWPVLAAGHPQLCRNYLEYRFSMLPAAREDARRLFGVGGAFFSDVSNLNGYNALEPDTVRNCSVGAQIAMDFYRYYRYTCDQEFLLERALPMLRACEEFYEGMLVEKDGRLVIRGGSTAYESYWNLQETLTDYASLQAVLRALMRIGEEQGFSDEERERYSRFSQKLYLPLTQKVLHRGEELEIYAAGKKWDGGAAGYGEGEYPWSPFPAALMSMVYPSGLIGLNEQGSQCFRIMKNTARVLLDREIYEPGGLGCSGHAPAPEMAARLGMAEDTEKVLEKYTVTYQIFPNGLMHFSDISKDQQWSATDRPRILSGAETCTQWEEVHEKDRGRRTQIPSEWFLHCYFEAHANLAAGIQEMLLQSVDGVLRVFPALPGDETAMFTLWAEGGFHVTSEAHCGEIRYIAVQSALEQECRIADPWGTREVTVRSGDGEEPVWVRENELICFQVAKDIKYMIFPSEFPPECYYQNPFDTKRNDRVKYFQNVSLGLEKYY